MKHRNVWYYWFMMAGVIFSVLAPGSSFSKDKIPAASIMPLSKPTVSAAEKGIKKSERPINFIHSRFGASQETGRQITGRHLRTS